MSELQPDKVKWTVTLPTVARDFLKRKLKDPAYIESLMTLESAGFVFSSDLFHLMTEFQEIFGENLGDVFTRYLKLRLDRYRQNLEKFEHVDGSDVSRLNNRLGSAFIRLNQAYDRIVEQNVSREDKLAVTFGTLFDESKCNHTSIRRWISLKKKTIEAYHSSLGIQDPALHNKRRGLRLRRQRKSEV